MTPSTTRATAELHRRQVLRLVDDHVPERPRRRDEQRVRLVEQRHVAVAPAAAPPGEELLLLGGEDPVRRRRQRKVARRQSDRIIFGRHDRP